MATYSKASVCTKTLVANTADTVNLSIPGRFVAVTNVDGADRISFTTNGATPTDKGDDCYVLPASVCSMKVWVNAQAPQVKLISTTTGTPTYSVEVLDR